MLSQDDITNRSLERTGTYFPHVKNSGMLGVWCNLGILVAGPLSATVGVDMAGQFTIQGPDYT